MELTGWEVITRKWENLHLLGQENILVAIRKKALLSGSNYRKK